MRTGAEEEVEDPLGAAARIELRQHLLGSRPGISRCASVRATSSSRASTSASGPWPDTIPAIRRNISHSSGLPPS